MSEKEKSGGNVAESSVLMVEQTTGHKQPYRPTELQGGTIHNKQPRAPLVPSISDGLKNVSEDSTNADAMDTKEFECVVSSGKQLHGVSKKVSSNVKRRGRSPEDKSAVDVEAKKDPAVSSAQPIPPIGVESVKSAASALAATDKDARITDDDSITEEVAELRTLEVTQKDSEWLEDEGVGGLPRCESRGSRVSRAVRQLFCCGVAYDAPSEDNVTPRGLQETNHDKKKKDVSWKDERFDEVVLKDLKARSEGWILEKKASVGPCFRSGMPYEGPSGITICLPKKSTRCLIKSSGININITGKCSANRSRVDVKIQKTKEKNKMSEKKTQMNCDVQLKFFGALKDKIDCIRNKIREEFF